jgi:hypothetical protein
MLSRTKKFIFLTWREQRVHYKANQILELILSKHPDPSSDWCYEEVLGRVLTLTARLFSVRHKVDKIGVDLGMFGSTARMASTAPALAIFIAFPYA